MLNAPRDDLADGLFGGARHNRGDALGGGEVGWLARCRYGTIKDQCIALEAASGRANGAIRVLQLDSGCRPGATLAFCHDINMRCASVSKAEDLSQQNGRSRLLSAKSVWTARSGSRSTLPDQQMQSCMKSSNDTVTMKA